MARSVTLNKQCANRAAVLTELNTQILAMGWTLHDSGGSTYSVQDANSWTVYTTTGETGTRLMEYVKIFWTIANTIRVECYFYWDATTNTGGGTNYNVSSFSEIITNESNSNYLYIWGDKDLVLIQNKASTTYTWAGFGHLKNRIFDNDVTVTSPNTKTNFTVDDPSIFVVGEWYQLLVATIGRYAVRVDGISGNQLTISYYSATQPATVPSGSKISIIPSTFGRVMFNGSTLYHYLTCTRTYLYEGLANITGTSAAHLSPTASSINTSYINPDVRLNRYTLFPIIMYETYSLAGAGSDSTIGYYGSDFVVCASLATEDTLGVKEFITGTVSATGSTANTLVDTTKSWGVNDLAGKVVIITAGTGNGQTRQIVSNTIDTLTLSMNWLNGTPPHSASYSICYNSYRYLSGNYAVKEY